MNYEIKQLLFDDSGKSLKQMIELQQIVYPDRVKQFNIDLFVSWYINNPMGRVVSFNAFYDNKIVAHYACVPVKMTIGNRIVSGLLDMATVTHPDHRGKGLFKTLAKETYNYAEKNGYEFVVGVANENSFPGYMKYFPFTFVDRLQVKFGYGNNIQQNNGILFSGYYDEEIMRWRASCGKSYSKGKYSIDGKYGKYVRVFMGLFDKKLVSSLDLPKTGCSLLPRLYVGIGANVKGFYMNVPKFIKHSPFYLIFLDLTDGKLPKVTNENIFFQLWDFDVV